MKHLVVFLSFIAGFNAAFGADLTEAEIRRAIDWGRSSGVSNLVHELKQRQRVLINRAGLRDAIEKRVTLVTDFYRVALESAVATRELREWGVEDVKRKIRLGLIEVLLEANCYNSLYAAGLQHWTAGNGHLVLRVDDKIVQPLEKRQGATERVSILPQQHGIVSRDGPIVTYTPLYRSALYERDSVASWYTFELPKEPVSKVTVVVIGDNGKQREKDIRPSLLFRNYGISTR